MLITTNKNFFYGLLLFFISIPAIYYDRFLGLIPYHYAVLYIIFFVYAYERKTVCYTQPGAFYFLFFIFYFLYSLIITTDTVSTLIYFFLWVFNISMFVISSSLSFERIKGFVHYYSVFILLSLFLGLFLFLFFDNKHANPYSAWDKNNFSFAVYLSFIGACFFKRYTTAKLILILSIFIFSRTLLLMMLVAFVIYFWKENKKKMIFLSSLILLILALMLNGEWLPFQFIAERLSGIVTLVNSLTEYTSSGVMSDSVQIDDWRRYYLIIANLDIIRNTFPLGTGMGLTNYLNHYDPSYITYVGHAGRAHNFVISYLAEMGLLFFVFITIIFHSVFTINNILFKAAMAGMLAGLITNEYITSPMFWILLGFAHNYKIFIKKDNNATV